MRNEQFTILFVICFLLFALLFCGCASLMEKTGQVFDGSAFREKIISAYRAGNKETGMVIREMQNRKEERFFLITLNQFPTMQIRCSEPNEQGEIFIETMHYLGGGYQGWNEFNMNLFGSGKFNINETTAAFSINEIEAVEITSGMIRRYDTLISGDEALTSLRNRRERILVLTKWMNSLEDAPKNAAQKDFEEYWKPILFPEITSRKKQPQNWRHDGDQSIRAEDINWNISYSERVFPEPLRIVRNSGTMLRDWEEALDWIHIKYEWDRIIDLLKQETTLNRTRS